MPLRWTWSMPPFHLCGHEKTRPHKRLGAGPPGTAVLLRGRWRRRTHSGVRCGVLRGLRRDRYAAVCPGEILELLGVPGRELRDLLAYPLKGLGDLLVGRGGIDGCAYGGR